VSLEAGIFLVGDEVGGLLEVLHRHVDGLRQLQLVRLDHLHRRIAKDQLVAPAVDAVSRSHLEREVTAAACRQSKSAALHRDDARRVQHAVVQAPFFQMIGFRRVPVLVSGEEAFEEVDPFEVGLLRHCILRTVPPFQQTTEGQVMSNQQLHSLKQ